MRVTICSHDINSLLLNDRSSRWTSSALGIEGPFRVMLFVSVGPQRLAGLFVKAMHSLARGRFGEFNVKHEHAARSYDRAGESAAAGEAPANLQTVCGKV